MLLMSLTFAHWIFILGAWDWMNRFDDRIFEDAVPMSTPDPMDQPMTKVTSSEPPTISKPSPPSPFEEVVVMTEEDSPSPESKDENNA